MYIYIYTYIYRAQLGQTWEFAVNRTTADKSHLAYAHPSANACPQLLS